MMQQVKRRGGKGSLRPSRKRKLDMTVQEAIAYINDYTWSSTRLGLDRTRELLERLGNPQKDLRFIHVAGTNGKGSTCAMIERILREAGFCTGFYPSPHLQDFRERIQVNGEYITEAALAAITALVAVQADAMEDHPSQFEIITAIGMLYFRQMRCDYVVLEVGMGGAMDSTNIIDPPEAAVITNIGLDHTEYLGSTLEEIARTKCGILKRGSAAVSYRSAPEAMAVIREICRDRMIPLYEAPAVASDAQDGEDVLEPLGHGLDGQRFRYRGREYRLSLLGGHQLRNAATVLKTVEALRDRGIVLPDEAVERGLALTEWPARFEVLSREPLLILDGGHNPQCAEALAENIREYLADENGRAGVTFLFGMLADKDYRRTLELLAPYGAAYVCITPESPRALPAEKLAELIRSERPGLPVVSVEEIPDAIAAALELERPVVAFGSLYSAGRIRTEAAAVIKRFQRKQALRARRALSPSQREEAGRAICAKLKETVQKLRTEKEIRHIFSYAAAWDEVNVDAFNSWAEEEGMQVAFPLCRSDGSMEARTADSGVGFACMLKPGAFGIREPKEDCSRPVRPEDIDLVVVPCVAFDGHGGRIGHGKGFYDRYLPQLRPDAEKILIAFEAQRLPEVKTVPTDFPIRRMITEKTE